MSTGFIVILVVAAAVARFTSHRVVIATPIVGVQRGGVHYILQFSDVTKATLPPITQKGKFGRGYSVFTADRAGA